MTMRNYGSRSQEGEEVLNFTLAYDFLIANTLFRKRESHLVTFRSGQHSSQIDYILARREDRRDCLDSKVFPGECVVPQHKLVVADFRFRVRVHRVSNSMVTLMDKRMTLELGKFSGFLHLHSQCHAIQREGWLHIYTTSQGTS